MIGLRKFMKWGRRGKSPWAGVVLVGLISAGCGVGSATIPETKYFIIDYSVEPAANAGSPLPVTIGIDSFRADAVYRTEKIVFRKVPYRVDFYPYERWGARPDEIVTDRLLDHLQASRRFQEVVRATGGADADYLVRGRIKRFEEVDGPDEKYSALAQIEISLLDRKTGKVILQKRLTRSTPAKNRPIQGFVDAMALNLRALLGEAAQEIAGAVARAR